MIKKDSILRDRNLYLVFSISLISTLGVSTVSPAFPKIMAALKISEAEVGMLITAFSIPGVILAPFIGVPGDRLGRKKVIVPSLFLFGIAGFACMFTNNFDLILYLRIFQGIGASGLVTLATTIVGDLYTGNRVPEAIGYNSSVVSFSLMVYPTIGGALALVDWHLPFILPVAAIPVGIMVIVRLHNPEPLKSSSFSEYLRGSWHCLKAGQLIGLFLAGIVGFVILFGAVQTYYPLLLAPLHLSLA
jgi:MFS family permease